jgi:hypothetical protein
MLRHSGVILDVYNTRRFVHSSYSLKKTQQVESLCHQNKRIISKGVIIFISYLLGVMKIMKKIAVKYISESIKDCGLCGYSLQSILF